MSTQFLKPAGVAAVVLALFTFTGCAEPTRPIAPTAVVAPDLQGAAATDPAAFVAQGTTLMRTDPLSTEEWTWTVLDPGVDGSMHLRESGLKVEFPAGSVTQRTIVWVVAHRGNRVIYSFGPHGTQFNKPVKIQQDLKGTTAWKNPQLAYDLRGGYVPDGPSNIAPDGTASIAELFGVDITPDNQRNPRAAKFYTTHFSGYILASGCRDFPDAPAFDR